MAINGQYVAQHPFADILAALQASLLQRKKHRAFAPAARDYLLQVSTAAAQGSPVTSQPSHDESLLDSSIGQQPYRRDLLAAVFNCCLLQCRAA